MDVVVSELWDTWLARRDESVFEKLVRPQLPATLHLARRMGLGRADAEDVVQEALLALAQVKSRRPGMVGVGAWLMRAVRLKSLTTHRSRRRRRKHETGEARPASRIPGREGIDVQEEVERALDLLDEDDRQILVFRFLYDLSYREIAYVLARSENACRIRVHRASERLRARLGGRSTTMLALLPVPAYANAAQAIAAATKGAAPGAIGSGVIGGLIMSTGWKMAASAAAAALLTAGAFMTLRDDPAPQEAEPMPVAPPVPIRVAQEPPSGSGSLQPSLEPAAEERTQPARPAPRPTAVRADGRLGVSVDVVGPAGVPLNEVFVRWTRKRSDTNCRHARWTAADPLIYLEPGDAWVHAIGGEHEGWKSAVQRVAVSGAGEMPVVRLTLEERSGIYGRVVLPGEFERPRLAVMLEPITRMPPPDNPVFRRGGPRASPRERDGYTYAFHDLAPGHYLVGLSLGREDAVLVKAVHVERGMHEQDLALAAFDPALFMEVRVLGPDGEPLADAHVVTCFKSKSMSAAGGNVELVRKDGVHIVDHNPRAPRRDDGSPGEAIHYVVVRNRLLGELSRTYQPGSGEPMTIRYREPAVVGVQLEGYERSPAAGMLSVGLRDRAGPRIGVRNPRRPSETGYLELGQSQPGRYELLLLGPQHRVRWAQDVEFKPGENRLSVRLPTFHTLELRFAPDAENVAIKLRRSVGEEQWSYGWAERNESGSAMFPLLTEGEYELEGHIGERRVLRKVNIPADLVIEIE